MGGHAVRLAPFGFATGAIGEVTEFGLHNAAITSRELTKARVTIPLRKGLLDRAITMDATDRLLEFNFERLANTIVQADLFRSKRQPILNLLSRFVLRLHLADRTLHHTPWSFGSGAKASMSTQPPVRGRHHTTRPAIRRDAIGQSRGGLAHAAKTCAQQFQLSADRFPADSQRIDSEKTHNSTRDVDQQRQSNSRRVRFVA
jgi:hypothetical protein